MIVVNRWRLYSTQGVESHDLFFRLAKTFQVIEAPEKAPGIIE
jgi:hypothetical protein